MGINVIMDDHDLLREYTEQGSEKAFSDLVERYLPLVYGTAYRIVREAHTAQDVAQSVFLQLARKAWTVREGRALPGWLYRCTQRAAFMAIRSEQRRARRETEAMNLAEQNHTPAVAWEHVAPLLDEALSHLSRGEQDAVILRFFQEKSYREVGVVCGLNENAARKRVERSLDKIRVHFASRGVTATAALLGTILAAHASEPPPLGLATRVVKSTAGNAAKIGGLSYFASQVFLYVTNFKVMATVVVVGGLAALPLLYQKNAVAQMREDLAASTQQVAQLHRELVAVNRRLDEATAVAASNADAATIAAAQMADLSKQISTSQASVLPDLSALDKINFVALDAKTFTLKPDAVSRLKITPEENAAVQKAIDQLRSRIQAHALATIQRLPVDALQGPNFVRFFKNHPGNQSLYLIPPMNKEEKDALVNPFAESMVSILGRERGDLLLQRSADNIDKWMTSGQGTVVAFADINASADTNLPVDGNAQGQPTTAWVLKRTLRDGSFNFTRGQGTAAVPAQLTYLFEPVPDDGSAASPPSNDPQN